MIVLLTAYTFADFDGTTDVYDVLQVTFDTARANQGLEPREESVAPFNQPSGQPQPGDYAMPAGQQLHQLCGGASGYDLITYFTDGAGSYTTTVDANNVPLCSYVAPAVVCTLLLSAAAAGSTITATVTGAKGNVLFSLDGGTPQASGVFEDVLPGSHQVRADDDGAPNCFRTKAVTVLPPGAEEPPVIPAGLPAAFHFSLHPIWHTAAAPMGAEVVLELWVEDQPDSETFSRVLTERKLAGVSSTVTFRLDLVLRRLLRAHVPEPAGPMLCSANRRNFFVRTARLNDVTKQPGAWSTSSLRTVVRGGLPVPYQGESYFGIWAQRQQLPPFLTWQPRRKRITSGQPEWLAWLCPPGTSNTVRVKTRYTLAAVGGSPGPAITQEVVMDLSGGRGSRYKLLSIPVDSSVAGLASVQVWLTDDAGETISEVFDYVVVPATERTRYFLFTNSLGGTDTLRTEGRREGALDTREELAERIVTPDRPAVLGSTYVLSQEATRKIKQPTGWLTTEQLDWLQELVLARERWEVAAGRLLPVLLTKKTLTYAQDDSALRGYTFEFEYAFEPTAYANLP
ncbi:hypothetical protein LJY25_08250 [Hymenobacter sp. BT175]|uniref:hypothetical protein n=1 Tax=Hymenobacter translucens TaxID=2886507 RepID=UPI001D0F3F83|nr:hypothetical protein [Hymenobacter translucens]MCC2546433.1 hypothetical protein [Hymenobacter translucens]